MKELYASQAASITIAPDPKVPMLPRRGLGLVVLERTESRALRKKVLSHELHIGEKAVQ
jgi:hypothetical protein